MENQTEKREKLNKYNLPILISVMISLIFLVAVFEFGAITLPPIIVFSEIISVLWILTFIAAQIFYKLEQYLSMQSITSAYIIYAGVLFISLSRFKDEIAKVPLDINMIGLGIALIALGFQFVEQRKETTSQKMIQSVQSSADEPDKQGKVQKIDELNLPSIEIVLEEVRRKQDFQFNQLDGIRTISGIVLGVDGVIFTILITILVTNFLGQTTTVTHVILAKIALIPLLISLVLSFIPIFIRLWSRPPNLNRLRDHYIVKGIKETQLNVIDKNLEAIDINQKSLNRLFFLTKCSYIMLLLALGLLAVWIGIAVV